MTTIILDTIARAQGRFQEASHETISRTARYAFERFQKYDFENDWQKYVGHYPPKKLEA